MKFFFGCFFLVYTAFSWGQNPEDTAIMQTVISHYFKNEKVVIKGRGSQFLFFYCEKPDNNEELMETVNALKLPPAVISDIRQQIQRKTSENWTSALDGFLENEGKRLQFKVNSCLTLEEFQKKQAVKNLNNQRLLILYKPIYLNNGPTALVKVVFYRTIEHNSGVVLKLEKGATGWKITQELNPWQT